MHLRLKLLTEIAISPILIGADGAPLQGGVKKNKMPDAGPGIAPSVASSKKEETGQGA